MNVKQLLLDIREALNKKDLLGAQELVGCGIDMIIKTETDEMEAKGKMQYENPILDLDRVRAVLAQPGVESLAINVVCVHQYRFNGIYVDFQFSAHKEDGTEPDNVTEEIWDEESQDNFSDFTSQFLQGWHESEDGITDAWALVALFGQYPDPKLIHMVLDQQILLGLNTSLMVEIFSNWDKFYATRFDWKQLQSRDCMVQDERSSDS